MGVVLIGCVQDRSPISRVKPPLGKTAIESSPGGSGPPARRQAFRHRGAAVFLFGPALGFFIGLISGFSVLLLIRTAAAGRATLKATVAEITQLLAIPTFCFGGPWLTSALFNNVDLDAVLPAYAISLSLTFALVAGYPLLMLIRVTCHYMEQKGPEL